MSEIQQLFNEKYSKWVLPINSGVPAPAPVSCSLWTGGSPTLFCPWAQLCASHWKRVKEQIIVIYQNWKVFDTFIRLRHMIQWNPWNGMVLWLIHMSRHCTKGIYKKRKVIFIGHVVNSHKNRLYHVVIGLLNPENMLQVDMVIEEMKWPYVSMKYLDLILKILASCMPYPLENVLL